MPDCAFFTICGLPDDADPQNRCCILHSRNPRKDSNAFAAALLAHRAKSRNFSAFKFPRFADFSETTLADEADFSNAVFAAGASFSTARFLGGATFAGATFFGTTTFTEAGFAKRVNFVRTTFEGAACFGRATFAAGANFYEATFSGDADFAQARFASRASFARATFTASARFTETTFADTAHLFRTTFAGRAAFGGATFAKGATFAEATFRQGADFDGAAFLRGKADFARCALLGPTRFAPRRVRKTTVSVFGDAEVDFRAVRIEPPDALAFVEANLDRCRFVDTDLRRVRLTGVTWAQLPWGLWARAVTRDAVYDEKQPERYALLPLAKLEDLYRQVKRNYEDQRDFDRVGDFHFGEKEMRRRNPATPFRLRLLLTLYRGVSGYGEWWLRPLALFLALLVAGAGGYLYCGVWAKDLTGPGGHLVALRDWPSSPGEVFAAVGQSLLFSLRVLTLLKPDDLVPVGGSRLIQTVQSLCGPILLGLAGLAIRQRLRR